MSAIPSSTEHHRPIVLRSAKHFQAISSQVRDQILQVVVFQTGSSCEDEQRKGISIHEIAEHIGRSAASIYRHIDALVDAELIHPIGATTTGGRNAQQYAADGNIIYLSVDRDDPEAVDALCKLIERSATWAGKQTAKATRRWIESSIGEGGDIEPNNSPLGSKDHAMSAQFGWLDPNQQESLRKHLHEVTKIFEQSQRRPNTKLISTSMFIHPVELPNGVTPAVSSDET